MFIVIEVTELNFEASANKFHFNNLENTHTKDLVAIGQQVL
jgi:hypothetical protein